MARKKQTSRKTSKKSSKSRPVKKSKSTRGSSGNSGSKSKKARKTPARKVSGSGRSRLSPEDLAEFRRLLLEKRAELVGDLTNLSNEALRVDASNNSGNLSHLPIHLADVGSDNWEQEFNLGLLATERQILREIDEALTRIEEGTYGICIATQKPISKKRLKAKPWARYCIEYARELELGRAPRE